MAPPWPWPAPLPPERLLTKELALTDSVPEPVKAIAPPPTKPCVALVAWLPVKEVLLMVRSPPPFMAIAPPPSFRLWLLVNRDREIVTRLVGPPACRPPPPKPVALEAPPSTAMP